MHESEAMTKPGCAGQEHGSEAARKQGLADRAACQRAAAIFRALGDPIRLQLLTLLMQGEMCVTEIAAALEDNLSAVSQRLKLLRSERIVSYRREGKHVFYALEDQHIAQLIANGLAHASESDGGER